MKVQNNVLNFVVLSLSWILRFPFTASQILSQLCLYKKRTIPCYYNSMYKITCCQSHSISNLFYFLPEAFVSSRKSLLTWCWAFSSHGQYQTPCIRPSISQPLYVSHCSDDRRMGRQHCNRPRFYHRCVIIIIIMFYSI